MLYISVIISLEILEENSTVIKRQRGSVSQAQTLGVAHGSVRSPALSGCAAVKGVRKWVEVGRQEGDAILVVNIFN